MKILLTNKNANRNYEIHEKIEAGIVLKGTEVKSVSKSQASINECYINISKNEVFALNMHINPFFEGNRFNTDPLRNKKLLLHRKEIIKLEYHQKKLGMTIIPINVYWKKGKIKMLIGLGKGKKLFDKRQDLKMKDQKKQIKYMY